MTNDRRRTVYIPPGEQEKARSEDYTFMFDPELAYKRLGEKRAKAKATQKEFYTKHGARKDNWTKAMNRPTEI